MNTPDISLVASRFAGRKALVVGLGDTGAACVRWLLEHDAQVRATDSRERSEEHTSELQSH